MVVYWGLLGPVFLEREVLLTRVGPGRASRAAGKGGAYSESESPQGSVQVRCLVLGPRAGACMLWWLIRIYWDLFVWHCVLSGPVAFSMLALVEPLGRDEYYLIKRDSLKE